MFQNFCIASIGGSLCPVAAMRAYLVYRHGSSYGSPLIFDNSDYLNRSYLAAFLKFAS